MELRNNEILRFEQSILIEKLINRLEEIEPQGRKDARIKFQNRKVGKTLRLNVFSSFIFYHSVFPSLWFIKINLHFKFSKFYFATSNQFSLREFLSHFGNLIYKEEGRE
jgi:hypothetical protein